MVENPAKIQRVEGHLLEGPEEGLGALKIVAFGEDDAGVSKAIENSEPAQPVFSAEQLYVEIEEHLAAQRYTEAIGCLKMLISKPEARRIWGTAYMTLGGLYKEGKGVEKSASVAFEYFNKAAQSEHAEV